MSLRFKCPNPACQKPLVVKEQLAGKRVACPACKQPLVVPAPVAAPADVESLAADALSDKPVAAANGHNGNGHTSAPAAAATDTPKTTIDFDCDFCGEPVSMPLDMAGKQSPCPHCRRVVRVPVPKINVRENWRDANKNIAPSAAKANQVEAVEGVQGGRAVGVSHESLREAGVITAPPKPPIGVMGWVRRATIAVAFAGIAVGIYFVLTQARAKSKDERTFEQVRDDVAKSEKLKAMPVLKAEAERLIAETLLVKRSIPKTGQKALEAFQAARGVLSSLPSARNDPAESLDADLMLIDLALATLELGAQKEDDLLTRDRLEWGDVDKELSRTIDRIQSRDGKAAALRRLSVALTRMKKPEIAAGLCSRFANQENQKAPLLAHLVAVGKSDLAANIAKQPNPAKEAVATLARVGYAEGFARQGKTSEATELIQAKGSATPQLEATIAVLDVLTIEGRGVTEIKPFLDEATRHFKDVRTRTVWPTLLWIRAAASIGDFSGAQEMVKSLPAGVRPRANLEILRIKMARSELPMPMAELDQLLPNHPQAGKGLDLSQSSRAQGIVALARRNAQLGTTLIVDELPPEDQTFKSLIELGITVGRSDRGAVQPVASK
ncbi:MAG: hypothetical protein K2X38_20025 [Gemmataceae bacterium]|nr:hypothetical protein [Gemmataceae bacterium]